MNSFNAIGRVGRDSVCRFTQSGKPVASWSLAVDSGYGQNKTTTWLDCSLWGDRAEKVAGYIRKGDQLGVSGEIGTREHDGKTYVTLNVGDVTLLGGKRDSEPAKPSRASVRDRPQPEATGGGFADEEIPFSPLGKRCHWIA